MDTITDQGFTCWTLIGFLGASLFSLRWIVQILYSKKQGKPSLPDAFWYMSALGSLLLLAYFVFGRKDPIGILSNAFPLLIAGYNILLLLKKRPTPASVSQKSMSEPG